MLQQNRIVQNKTRSISSSTPSTAQINSLNELWYKIDHAIKQSNQSIEAKIESCLTKINAVEEKLELHKAECASQILALSTALAEVQGDLDAANDSAERLAKSSELIISSIPYTTNENLKSTFRGIAEELGYTSVPTVALKRLANGNTKTGESPAILCQFAFRIERQTFYKKYLEHRNLQLSHIGYKSTNRIYINENLTHAARIVRCEALKLKRLGHLHQICTRDGVVFVKPSSTTHDAAVACHSLVQLEKAYKSFPI